MLIEFTVANYRSFRDPQTLSMAASSRKELLEENTFDTGIPGLPRLLRSAVVYGANASGKSNLIKAMRFAWSFIEASSRTQDGDEIPHYPFKLDPKSKTEPSTFEFIFISEGVRYQYGFAVDSERVHREWLIAYPKGKAQTWFERTYISETKTYDWKLGPNLKGERKQWQALTRSNNLFLSTAVQLNSDQLKPVLRWFDGKLVVIGFESKIDPLHTAAACHNRPEIKSKILELMSAADLGIDGIYTEEREFNQEDVPKNIPSDARDKVVRKFRDATVFNVRFMHGDTSFDLSEESDGTQKLFSLALPLIDIIGNGRVVVIDELSNSLHPFIVKFLLSILCNSTINQSNAQLFFSTHDTSLLDTDFLRRDQIWLTEKDGTGATRLYSLLEFSPRQKEALEKGYLSGRYGGLPFISAWTLRGEHAED